MQILYSMRRKYLHCDGDNWKFLWRRFALFALKNGRFMFVFEHYEKQM